MSIDILKLRALRESLRAPGSIEELSDGFLVRSGIHMVGAMYEYVFIKIE